MGWDVGDVLLLRWCWAALVAVGGEGVGQGLLDRRGMHAECVGDLAAVDDERLGELVLHFEQLAHRAVGECGEPKEEGRYLADPGRRRARVLEGELAELPGGAGMRVVGQVPDLSRRVGVLAEYG